MAARGWNPHLEHLAIIWKTVTGTVFVDRIPTQLATADLPQHRDYPPRILAVCDNATGPLRARDVCGSLGCEPLA
ncbi:hypothetical protein [Streptomyces sp. NPDC051992]|uniref:hypothetical protein n=1 Tax=Streptomyces sp. NPDC051992 TaxID=3161012 RepID=UPI0034124731